jgi:hypothetical protein
VLSLPLPPATARGGVKRLELLRDQALLLTLFCTGMRRAGDVAGAPHRSYLRRPLQ